MSAMGTVPHGIFAQHLCPNSVKGIEELGSGRRRIVGAQLANLRTHNAAIKRVGASRRLRGCGTKRGDQNRNVQLSTRCTIEPREGIRNFAPVVEPQSVAVPGSGEWKNVTDIWRTAVEKFGDHVALNDPHHDPPTKLTFKEAYQEILDFSEGLRVYGLKPSQKVALISENSYRWLIADQGILSAGAVNAVRGTRSSPQELCGVITHSDSVALVVDTPETYNKLASHLQVSLMFVVVLWPSKSANGHGSAPSGTPTYTYDDLIKTGRTSLSRRYISKESAPSDSRMYTVDGFNSPGFTSPQAPSDASKSTDLATIVYTSGTSGSPKGVMLSHANLLHQIVNLPEVVKPVPGEIFLSLLPPWHMYERSAEYFVLSQGVCVVYTSTKRFKVDLARYPTDFFVAVPLVFSTMYSAIMTQIANGSAVKKAIAMTLIAASLKYKQMEKLIDGRALAYARVEQSSGAAKTQWLIASFMLLILWPLHILAQKIVFSKILASICIKKAAISGGGSLPSHIDNFFEAVGITVLNGYGLTETSPVAAARVAQNNVLGSVGRPIAKTEIIVVNPLTGKRMPPGEKGIVKIRGPQVMKGYYKNPEATEKAIDKDGYFDSGDIGWIAPFHEVGAARKCGGVLVLDGREKDTIVLSSGENIEPTQIEEIALQSLYVNQIMVVGQDERRLGALIVPNRDEGLVGILSEEELEQKIRQDLNKLAPQMQCPIGPFKLIDEPFSVENGLLTPTLKMKRGVIYDNYSKDIADLYPSRK
ncbi:long-chain acyl-CoA synthetase [Marchantia polymorpha subsp. ruderalis]|uniref:AMP-dependent synthetase/ligase domain-containing protein n=3 Tax=Marchantia polymorpha TaxID=3197 RepID=A0AAF6BBH7_MARPO|nr:hypothetical protein MARPO_0169s0028 [Marchantia polymorpha]BBN09361.1 hypothetical protein Mp_4g19160 [Marchantia polymorpha subsp. ruderalis]|eukprot:PTQ28268.1 hypothetical protein MARPO_0169s0028 [Marchantia polymorpha]